MFVYRSSVGRQSEFECSTEKLLIDSNWLSVSCRDAICMMDPP